MNAMKIEREGFSLHERRGRVHESVRGASVNAYNPDPSMYKQAERKKGLLFLFLPASRIPENAHVHLRVPSAPPRMYGKLHAFCAA